MERIFALSRIYSFRPLDTCDSILPLIDFYMIRFATMSSVEVLMKTGRITVWEPRPWLSSVRGIGGGALC